MRLRLVFSTFLLVFGLFLTARLPAEEPAETPAAETSAEAKTSEAPQAEGTKAAETEIAETSGFQAIVVKHNKAAVAEIKAYIDANPKAEDIDQAYLFLFQNAMVFDSDAETLALADKYLAREEIEPQLKTIALQVRAVSLVKQGNTAEGIKVLAELLGDRRTRNPGAIVDFGFSLANRLQLAGDFEAVKACYEKIGEAFPLNQQLESMIQTRLDRLSLVGQPAPVLKKAKDWEGKEIDLAEYKGKVLLIDFWATNCGPCIQELPNVIQCYHKFHDSGFEILGISLDEVQEQAESLVKRAKIPWRQAMNDTGSGELSADYYVPTIPALYLVDQEGKIAFTDLRGDDLRQAIEQLIAKGNSPGSTEAAKN